MKTLAFVLLFGVPCFGFEPLSPDKTCPNLTIPEFYMGDFLDTCKEGQTPHCLLDDQNRHGRVCVKVETIPQGECPFYNTKKGKMERRKCIGEDCPKEDIPSTAAVLYQEMNYDTKK
ncbi:uncharacterized protein LOC133196711 isoform X2 [Saccostrea echinata]|uniref:uncharacterized protein LOC133196711 isoform X2 n=1 Tax=Saccostrea echinata TaxID=191078 RepID=UPI002A81AC6D|nr:uncharacterized protein LOC133196711 isoform X2 [Saccostrea echinata]